MCTLHLRSDTGESGYPKVLERIHAGPHHVNVKHHRYNHTHLPRTISTRTISHVIYKCTSFQIYVDTVAVVLSGCETRYAKCEIIFMRVANPEFKGREASWWAKGHLLKTIIEVAVRVSFVLFATLLWWCALHKGP